jgi:glycogen operon protein
MSLNQMLRQAKTAWHGVKLNQPDWSPSSRSVAFTAEVRKEKLRFHLILNAYWETLDFELPAAGKTGGNPWRRWIDTALASPNDIVDWQRSPSIEGNSYRAEPRSVVVLIGGIE